MRRRPWNCLSVISVFWFTRIPVPTHLDASKFKEHGVVFVEPARQRIVEARRRALLRNDLRESTRRPLTFMGTAKRYSGLPLVRPDRAALDASDEDSLAMML